jgi:hypothetical protein
MDMKVFFNTKWIPAFAGMTKRGTPQIRLSGKSRSPVQGFRWPGPQIDGVYLIMDSLVMMMTDGFQR